jgi:hypothetical protein
MAIWQRYSGDISAMSHDELITLLDALKRFEE